MLKRSQKTKRLVKLNVLNPLILEERSRFSRKRKADVCRLEMLWLAQNHGPGRSLMLITFSLWIEFPSVPSFSASAFTLGCSLFPMTLTKVEFGKKRLLPNRIPSNFAKKTDIPKSLCRNRVVSKSDRELSLRILSLASLTLRSQICNQDRTSNVNIEYRTVRLEVFFT